MNEERESGDANAPTVDVWSCTVCDGTGSASHNCEECEGEGVVDCRHCGSSMTCPECDDADCESCGGSGEEHREE